MIQWRVLKLSLLVMILLLGCSQDAERPSATGTAAPVVSAGFDSHVKWEFYEHCLLNAPAETAEELCDCIVEGSRTIPDAELQHYDAAEVQDMLSDALANRRIWDDNFQPVFARCLGNGD